ncbi:hypothetical protein K504DRAFT_465815 [Pleomassaria siparia CBS 279.74]|uniref:Uncharacterized protein n=1 Tax=Pleomassaria siparia CBS 279.74 TaxID=1314801 RepID=A0A6G1KD63_9PLEO|nr:hypothetical protein K504DRAFT_465815 [Pleomassaria siparia CBS 279.74]
MHEVQIMELALRKNDPNYSWLAGLDKCIKKELGLDNDNGMLNRNVGFDRNILHLPALWKRYHHQLEHGGWMAGGSGSFWISMIRVATSKRLEVACGKKHDGYDVDSARSAWDEDLIEEQTDSWNENVSMDCAHSGEYCGGAEYWDCFRVL